MPPEKNESTRIYLFRAMALSLTAMKYCDTHTATKTITGLLVHISLCSKFRLYIYWFKDDYRVILFHLLASRPHVLRWSLYR